MMRANMITTFDYLTQMRTCIMIYQPIYVCLDSSKILLHPIGSSKNALFLKDMRDIL